MNAIFSTDKYFLDLIFDKTKNIEFRKTLVKNLHQGDKIYFYETKRHGSGMVVGYATIKDIVKIKHLRAGTMFLLPFYVEKYGTEEEKKTVDLMMSVDLENYDNSLLLDYLFDEKSLNEAKRTKKPRGFSLNNREIPKFLEQQRKAQNLCSKCDDWGRKIGFYDNFGESSWDYAYILEDPKRFDAPKKVSEFKGLKGTITTAPQSFCYLIEEKG